nr:hypothetical protein JVH1_1024 [Rhodococcus sp. JVH1]
MPQYVRPSFGAVCGIEARGELLADHSVPAQRTARYAKNRHSGVT